MKFKVGDKVKVVLITEDIERTNDVTLGDIGVIIELDDDNRPYRVESKNFRSGEGDWYWFTEDALELVVVDNVNNPNHYASTKIECIVAMEAMLSSEEFIGYLRGNIFKYQWRYKQKNGIEDLKKAQWYQNKLIDKELEKEST